MKHHSDPSSTQFERAKQNSVSSSDALCSILGNLQNQGISESCGDGFSFLINAPWACQVFLVGLRGGSCTLRPVAFGGCLWTLGWEMKRALMNCDIPVYVWQEGGLEAQVWSGMSFLGWKEMIFRGILEESLKQISWAAVAKSFQLNDLSWSCMETSGLLWKLSPSPVSLWKSVCTDWDNNHSLDNKALGVAPPVSALWQQNSSFTPNRAPAFG